ncbi:MAG TPA: IS66 family transposase [Edaphobacter sp.]|nr:IS66 family transposase [Edaphobacter sp.]
MSAPLQPMLPPHSEAFVAEVIGQLERQLESKVRELEYAQLKIRMLEERLRLERIAKYGNRSEKLSDLQLELLDLEPGVSSEEVEAESERDPIVAPPEDQQQDKPEDKPQDKSRRKHPGRQALPAHLERVEQIVACTAEQCACGQCGKETPVIGYEETEVLDVKPAEYFVTVIKREKRACKSCEEQGVRTAAVPERIVPKSLLSDRIIVDIVVDKYCESLPLYRQQAAIKRDAGVVIALSTIDDAVMRVGELLMPIAAAMKRELLAGTYIQADETPIGVQMHDKRGKNHQAYMWQYGSPGKGVVFDFRMGRDGDGPKQFLGQFNGLLQTDGYKAYANVGGPTMVHACCLAHARRKFVDAVKVDAKDQDSARIVALMDELFAIDREGREKKMDHAARHALRMEKAPRLLEQLRAELLSVQKMALPKSIAGQAASYTLSLWQKLTMFLKYPELELSTNLAENSMRPIALGRRNWLHLGSKEAGPRIAAIFSVVESCRRLGVPIRNYMAVVLPGLANRSIQSLAQLTPTAYAVKSAK